ncbi:MAG: SBBP repeat-containing protein, partial [Pseudomonadota bacterium]
MSDAKTRNGRRLTVGALGLLVAVVGMLVWVLQAGTRPQEEPEGEQQGEQWERRQQPGADRAAATATATATATAASAASDPSDLRAKRSANTSRANASRLIDSIPPPIVAAAGPGSAGGFVLRDGGVSAFFVESGIAFALTSPKKAGWGLHWNLVGADLVEPQPQGELPGRASYFVGEKDEWRAGLPTYSRLAYANVLPGIDMAVESRRHGVEYRFVVEPGARLDALRLRYRGARAVRVVEDGLALEIETGSGLVREDGLTCYQQTPTGRREVAIRYAGLGRRTEVSREKGGDWEYGFAIGEHDPTRELVIDPVIGWSTYLGGTTAEDEVANAIAADNAGNAYVVGKTYSADFPVVVGGFDTTYAASTDVFVTKVDAAGASLGWSTFLGGVGWDVGSGIAVDGSGCVYVVGNTSSSAFPASGGYDTVYNGGSDAFVAKFAASGDTLVWSSFLGGSSGDSAQDIAIDGSGNAYAAGITYSADFPAFGGFDSTFGGTEDGFVAKIAAVGSSLVWSSLLGGSAADYVNGIATDSAGNAYVAGYTESADFPVANGFDSTLGGSRDAFVAKVAAAGSNLVWSSFLGGAGNDLGNGVAVDAVGNAYVTGYTTSTDFPATNGFDTTNDSYSADAFVTKVNAGGARLSWSSYLGGSAGDYAYGVAVNTPGNVYVGGYTVSSDFPASGGFDTTLASSSDAFVTRIDQTPNGASCTTAAECASDICEDGMCCARECGLCSSCDATGSACTVVPADDAACGVVECDGLDGECRSYHDLSSLRCEAAGDCKDANSSDCDSFTNAVIGTACADTTPADCSDARCDGAGACNQDQAAETAGYVCAGSSGLPCDLDDVCDGVTGGSCPPRYRNPDTQCFAALSSQCDAPEYCTGTTPDCPAEGGHASAGTSCTDTTPSDCYDARCDGAGYCSQTQAVESAFYVCSPHSGLPCDLDDVCDGVTGDTCPVRYQAADTPCRAALDPVCDLPERCEGPTPDCPPEGGHAAAGAVCTDTSPGDCDDARCDGDGACNQTQTVEQAGFVCALSSGLPCDTDDVCSGAAGGACPPRFVVADTVCREALSTECDAPERCTGSAPDCPFESGHAAIGAACTDSSPGDCDDARCDGAGACNQTQTVELTGYVCAVSSGLPCDRDDVCSGAAGGACPPRFVTADTVCRDALNAECDAPEHCTGTTSDCPPESGHAAAGAVCTDTSPADCDDARCDGAGACNQTQTVELAGYVCAASSGLPCDRDDVCSGAAGGACPPRFVAADTACRPIVNSECDTTAEYCTGSTADCPPQAGARTAGTTCTDTSPADCDDARCDGAGACNQTQTVELAG